MLNGDIPLSTFPKRKLKKHKATLRRLNDKRVRHSAKKRLLVKRVGFLIPLLSTDLPILASVIFLSQTTQNMFRKIILHSYKPHSSLTDAGGKPTTRSLKRKRQKHRLPKKRVKCKRLFHKKNLPRKTRKRKRTAATLLVCKTFRKAKKDKEDRDKNKTQIRAIASFLQKLNQILATSETVTLPQHQIQEMMS